LRLTVSTFQGKIHQDVASALKKRCFCKANNTERGLK